MSLFPWFLLLHILGAIVAFGPSLAAFPIIGAMGGREPMHVNFALRVSERLAKRVVIPLAIFQGITGLGLVWSLGINILQTGWLLLAIVLYLIALGIGIFVQGPTVGRLVELTSKGPPPMPAGGPPPGAPAGPPPEVATLVRRSQLGGMALSILIVAIVFLMVVKPF